MNRSLLSEKRPDGRVFFLLILKPGSDLYLLGITAAVQKPPEVFIEFKFLGEFLAIKKIGTVYFIHHMRS